MSAVKTAPHKRKFLDNYERKKESLLKITIFYVTGVISGLAIAFFVNRNDRLEAKRTGRKIVDWEDAPSKPTIPIDYNDPASYEPPPFLRWSYNEDMGYGALVDTSEDESVSPITASEAAERCGLRPDDINMAADKHNMVTADKHMVMSWNLADDLELDKMQHSLPN